MGNSLKLPPLTADASDWEVLQRLCSCDGPAHISTRRCAGVWMDTGPITNSDAPGPHGERYTSGVGWKCGNLVCEDCVSLCDCPERLLCKECATAPVYQDYLNKPKYLPGLEWWGQYWCTKCGPKRWKVNKDEKKQRRKNRIEAKRKEIDSVRKTLSPGRTRCAAARPAHSSSDSDSSQ